MQVQADSLLDTQPSDRRLRLPLGSGVRSSSNCSIRSVEIRFYAALPPTGASGAEPSLKRDGEHHSKGHRYPWTLRNSTQLILSLTVWYPTLTLFSFRGRLLVGRLWAHVWCAYVSMGTAAVRSSDKALRRGSALIWPIRLGKNKGNPLPNFWQILGQHENFMLPIPSAQCSTAHDPRKIESTDYHTQQGPAVWGFSTVGRRECGSRAGPDGQLRVAGVPHACRDASA